MARRSAGTIAPSPSGRAFRATSLLASLAFGCWKNSSTVTPILTTKHPLLALLAPGKTVPPYHPPRPQRTRWNESGTHGSTQYVCYPPEAKGGHAKHVETGQFVNDAHSVGGPHEDCLTMECAPCMVKSSKIKTNNEGEAPDRRAADRASRRAPRNPQARRGLNPAPRAPKWNK